MVVEFFLHYHRSHNLVVDVGRQVLAFYGEPQYSTVGDTFAVGCRVGDSVVYRDTTFHDNPDVTDPRYR